MLTNFIVIKKDCKKCEKKKKNRLSRKLIFEAFSKNLPPNCKNNFAKTSSVCKSIRKIKFRKNYLKSDRINRIDAPK